MFVDDSLFVSTTLVIKHSMVASIEALYIALGFPDLTARQNPLSLDKYSQSVCSYEQLQLDTLVKSRLMSFGITNTARLAMIQEFVHWHDYRKAFTLLQGITLCGNFEDWSGTSP